MNKHMKIERTWTSTQPTNRCIVCKMGVTKKFLGNSNRSYPNVNFCSAWAAKNVVLQGHKLIQEYSERGPITDVFEVSIKYPVLKSVTAQEPPSKNTRSVSKTPNTQIPMS